jgi:3-deoxy-manno-octulosonate cytidylyltransferase (CMP-KDO synthetase)
MLTNKKVLAVIPARWASTRFPGKSTADILGKPMIQWVFEQVQKSNLVNDVVVATDDKRIYDVVCEFGGNAVMTLHNHQSGTDRAAEVAEKIDCDIVVNIQGDEPLIPPENIDLVINPLRTSTELSVSTLMIGILNQNEMLDPNICKVVINKEGYALYFSRAPVPYNRDSSIMDNISIDNNVGLQTLGYKHIGIYAYTKSFLLKFSKLKVSRLECLEKLEQLRILENGYSIMVTETNRNSIGVDRPEDLVNVEAVMKSKK